MILGCDIAWQKPTGAQLAAVGVRFASLYVGQDNTGKNMTPAVVADYAAHGIAIITNFEYGASQMLGGAPQGKVDATLGLSQSKYCGMPDGRPIIYSADWAASATQITSSIIPYLVAARGVTGPGTVGSYGSYSVVTAVNDYWAAHFPGERIFLWQTVAWSGSSWAQLNEVEQLGGSMTVGGITIDQDYAPAGVDVGQWIPGGVDVPLTTADLENVAGATEDRPLGVIASPDTVPPASTTLGKETASNPVRWAKLFAQINALNTAVSAVAAPVDVKALAAVLATAMQPAIASAVAAGIAPEADQLAVTFEQHLSATLATSK